MTRKFKSTQDLAVEHNELGHSLFRALCSRRAACFLGSSVMGIIRLISDLGWETVSNCSGLFSMIGLDHECRSLVDRL